VWLVELAPLADPGLVPKVVAAVLGVGEEPGRPQLDTLVDVLRPKRLLLLLDNCEHLLEACARLADALLRACPHLQVLATSREALGITGEVTWRVPSLTLPAGPAVHTVHQLEGPIPVEGLAQSEAVRLFLDRAAVVQPRFAVTSQTAPAVAIICQRLDGIPLAIELAAARVRALSVDQLATRLEDRFRLLTGGSRTALERQQTLRAAVDWSYDLLTEPERLVFRRLAAFAGGFTLEAAEAVGAGAELAPDDILDLLTRLVDKSLVTAEALPEETTRYRLLETLRQYAQQKLVAAEEVEAVRTRHAAYYLALAEQAAPALLGPQQVAWLDRLEREHDNLRLALAWLAERGAQGGAEAAEAALHMGTALTRFWVDRGHFALAWEWLQRLLALPGVGAARPPAPAPWWPSPRWRARSWFLTTPGRRPPRGSRWRRS
jgi:non-specific serine/threonine protein kinase